MATLKGQEAKDKYKDTWLGHVAELNKLQWDALDQDNLELQKKVKAAQQVLTDAVLILKEKIETVETWL